jgi:hypothetical protein
VIAGAHKLRQVEDLRRVFISLDEPPDVRRRNIIERLRYRARKDGKFIEVTDDGVLVIDGIQTFSLQRGFLASQQLDHNSGI